MTEAFFSFDGLRFRYLEWGPPAAEPIVLVHGFSSTADGWVRVGETLASEYHVVAPDLRGHGETEWDVQQRYTDEQLAADVRALVSHLNLRPFTLVGHSMGGAVAFTYAARYPGDVTRLIIEDSAPMPPGRTIPEPRSTFGSRAEVEQSVREAQPNMPDEAVQRRVDVYYRARPDATWGYRADVVAVRRGRRDQHPDTLWADVRNVQCPTLVIRAGGEPPLVSEDTAARLTRENAHIEVVTVPGANHNIHFAHFDAFMPLVRQFLTQPVAAAST
jgi:esterase